MGARALAAGQTISLDRFRRSQQAIVFIRRDPKRLTGSNSPCHYANPSTLKLAAG